MQLCGNVCLPLCEQQDKVDHRQAYEPKAADSNYYNSVGGDIQDHCPLSKSDAEA